MKTTDIKKAQQDPRWFDTYRRVEIELSEKQPYFCICGRLATGMHERTCRRFHKLVAEETAKQIQGAKP